MKKVKLYFCFGHKSGRKKYGGERRHSPLLEEFHTRKGN